MSEYAKDCIFCKEKIQMSDKSNKWLPYNQDGSIHECKSKNGKSSVPNNGNGNDISLELVLAKLRKIGVDINLDVLKNVPVNGNGK